MTGYLNLHRFTTFTLNLNEGGWYVVLSDGHHRMGIPVEDEDAGRALLESISRHFDDDKLFWVESRVDEVRSYKPKAQDVRERRITR